MQGELFLACARDKLRIYDAAGHLSAAHCDRELSRTHIALSLPPEHSDEFSNTVCAEAATRHNAAL